MNIFVYLHKRKDNGEVFYVGIGESKRPYRKDNRNNYWHNVVNKCGYDVEIIHSNLLWEDACEIEKRLISEYGRKDLGLGPLVNMTDGGDGKVGFVFSEESKKKIGESNKGRLAGDKNPFYGKNHSPEVMAQINKTRKENPWIPNEEQKLKWRLSMDERDYHPTDEIISRISKNMPHHCPIDVWIKEGDYVGRFHGYSTFVREVLGLRAHDPLTKKSYTTAVSKICGIVRGRIRNKSYKGYTFKLVNNE